MKTTNLKKIFKLLWKNYIYDIALQYVEKTTNKYDDKALQFINTFIIDIN